jgi:hypothetical protein
VIIQDTSGDGVIDPGEAFDLVFELTNNSPLVNATGVTAGLAVVANPYVTLTDGSGSFGNIALGGGTGDNSGDVFSLTAGAGAPQGFEFSLFLTVYAQNGYEKTFDVKLFVGLPEWLDHAIGGVHLTVTDQGIIGYMGTAQIEGNGFGPIDGGTGLYIGSFWGGTDVNYICNNDFGNGDIAEWEVTESPNGRVRDLGALLGDQTYQGIYADTGHSSPKPMVVTRLSYAWTSPPFDEFVIMQYTVRNDGPSTVNDYHVGIFCDFDIGGAYDDNEGDTDATRKLTYMRDGGSTSFYGIALLGDSPLKNLTMIHNPTYVYPSQHIDDGIKSRHLKGIMSLATTTGPDDWSCLTSAGPFSVAAGDSIVVALALVYGTSLQELQDNTEAANQALTPTPVTDLIPVKFNLSQNHPNPFNPATTIKFNVEHEGQVEIAVYDLSGRKVKSLVSQNYGVGEYSVMWDGTDDAGARMPSGMYVYRYESGSKSVAKKMMLVK